MDFWWPLTEGSKTDISPQNPADSLKKTQTLFRDFLLFSANKMLHIWFYYIMMRLSSCVSRGKAGSGNGLQAFRVD